MDKINITTVSGVATSATAVPVVIPEYQKAKAVIRRFSALGNDAACAVKFYVPKVTRLFLLSEALAAAATSVKIPVDVAGGHVFRGHTLTTTDKLLVLLTSGWTLVTITAVTNVASADYCTATIDALGEVVPVNTKTYVLVPATDVVDGLPAIGNAAVTVEDFISGDSGAPLLYAINAAADKSTVAAAFVEYWF